MRYWNRRPRAKKWSLYHAGEKIRSLLLQLGTRVLVFMCAIRMLYEIPPAQITHKVTILLSARTDKPEKPLALPIGALAILVPRGAFA